MAAFGIVAVAAAAEAIARRRLTWNHLSALNFPVTTGTPSPRPHIIAASAALLALVLALAGGWVWCEQLETRFVDALSRDLSEAKLQGVALQRAAFAQPDLLVLYGSSELMRDVPNTAAQFFEDYPTGFRVFPVGKMGTASLAMLQKVAAVGAGLNGHKVAFSISPSYFFEETIDPSYYVGNFSALQASQLAFSTDLSIRLKRDIARRMLAYPKTLDGHWLLESTLRRLARGGNWDRCVYYATVPLGALQNLVSRSQDHFEAAMHILDQPGLPEDPPKKRRVLNWNENLRRSSSQLKKASIFFCSDKYNASACSKEILLKRILSPGFSCANTGRSTAATCATLG